jgi:hypothetical protein
MARFTEDAVQRAEDISQARIRLLEAQKEQLGEADDAGRDLIEIQIQRERDYHKAAIDQLKRRKEEEDRVKREADAATFEALVLQAQDYMGTLEQLGETDAQRIERQADERIAKAYDMYQRQYKNDEAYIQAVALIREEEARAQTERVTKVFKEQEALRERDSKEREADNRKRAADAQRMANEAKSLAQEVSGNVSNIFGAIDDDLARLYDGLDSLVALLQTLNLIGGSGGFFGLGSGVGFGATNTYNGGSIGSVNVTVQGGSSGAATADSIMESLIPQITQITRGEIINQKRPGGSLSQGFR